MKYILDARGVICWTGCCLAWDWTGSCRSSQDKIKCNEIKQNIFFIHVCVCVCSYLLMWNEIKQKIFFIHVCVCRARRSGGVIWFGEGSPKEGDRIIAWYKSEWELGLSWVFTGQESRPWNKPGRIFTLQLSVTASTRQDSGPSWTLATRNVSPIWCSYQHRLKPAGDVRLQIISCPHRMWCVLSDISQI